GFKGRTSVAEILVPDENVEEMILRGERVSVIREYLEGGGHRSMARNGLMKAAEGMTTIDEVQKAVMS
ncbi:MAG TPA: type II/IV secretion system protein, partial [Spirochaetia bacterium]